jgi:CDP-diacylglycerol--glycerol-3-phosphate 3-phosphatidyltransferase
MLTPYREALHGVADPVARLLLRARLQPNQLTVLGLVVSLIAAHSFSQGRLRTAALLLALAGLCDFFDGAVARLSGSVSEFGAFLDSVVDRYSDLVVLMGIVILYERADDFTGLFFTMLAVVGTIMTSYTRARAQSVGVACDVGLLERPERLIILIAGALFGLLLPTVVALALLTNLTALQRIFHVRKAAGRR